MATSSKRKDQVGGGKPGPGRPRGRKNVLPQGARRALRAVHRYQREIEANRDKGRQFELEDEQACEMMGIILSIARGETRGRHLGFRLAAAARILEEKRGKPKQKIETNFTGTLAALVGASLVEDGLALPPGPALPHPGDAPFPVPALPSHIPSRNPSTKGDPE